MLDKNKEFANKQKLTDPVCEMAVTETSNHHILYTDKNYYFCSQHYEEKFEASPASYLNTTGVPVAAGVLYPVFGLLLSPVIAAAAMSFSSVPVIVNSLRLKRTNL